MKHYFRSLFWKNNFIKMYHAHKCILNCFIKVNLKSVLVHFIRFVKINPVGIFSICMKMYHVTCETATIQNFTIKYRNLFILFYNFGIFSVK